MEKTPRVQLVLNLGDEVRVGVLWAACGLEPTRSTSSPRSLALQPKFSCGACRSPTSPTY